MRLFVILLLLCQLTLAQDLAPRAPENELAELLGGREQLLQIHKQLINTMVLANPDVAPYQPAIEAWAQQYITWEAIEEEVTAMYRQYFTDEELRAMVAFYRSETGRKAVLLMPALLREANLIGETLALEHKEALIQMLRETQQGADEAQ